MYHPGQMGQAASPVPDQGVILTWHFLLVLPLSCKEGDGHIFGQRCAVSAGKVAGRVLKKGLWLALREPRTPITSIWSHLLPDPGPRIRETHYSYDREPHTETYRRVERTCWRDLVFTGSSMADALPSAGGWFGCGRHHASNPPKHSCTWTFCDIVCQLGCATGCPRYLVTQYSGYLRDGVFQMRLSFNGWSLRKGNNVGGLHLVS